MLLHCVHTKEYTEDKNGNMKRQQNKGDVVFEGETVVGSWVIQKGAKAKSANEWVQQRASGSRAERSKRTLDVSQWMRMRMTRRMETRRGRRMLTRGQSWRRARWTRRWRRNRGKTGKGRGGGGGKKTLQQEFFQAADSEEEEDQPRRDSKRRRKASQEEDATLTDREVVSVNNGLEQYGVPIDSVGTHVKLCLSNNVHAGHYTPVEIVQLWHDVTSKDRVLVADTYFGSHGTTRDLVSSSTVSTIPNADTQIGGSR